MNTWGDVELITSLKWYLGYCWVSARTPWVQLCVWLKIHAFTEVIEIRMMDLHISSTCYLYIANIVFNSNQLKCGNTWRKTKGWILSTSSMQSHITRARLVFLRRSIVKCIVLSQYEWIVLKFSSDNGLLMLVN